MPGTVAELRDLEVSDLRGRFSATALQRGATYARTHRVLGLQWDEQDLSLSAEVIGNGAMYGTTAHFDDYGGRLEFADGDCSCPVGYNCKHVVAVVLAARELITAGTRAEAPASSAPASSAPATPPATPPVNPPSVAPAPAAWERVLRPLVTARAARSTGAPLAIELKLTANRYAPIVPTLMARLMRPGARGGWVNGSLDWGRVEWQAGDAGLREDHIELVRELYRLHQLDRSHSYSYGYGYGGERSIDLSACNSPQLWDLLEEAHRVGLPLIHAHTPLGEVAPPLTGELVLDVVRAVDGFVVRAVTHVRRMPADDPALVRFIGAHGMIWADREDVETARDPSRWRLWLVRLARSTPPELERMLRDGVQLPIAEGDIDRFAAELSPGLRNVVPVVSSDGSFTPPTVSPPALVLRVQHGPQSLTTVGWEWEYEIGDARRRAPLGGPDDEGFRDHDAERELTLATLLDEPALQAIGLLDDAGRPAPGPPATLAGLDSLTLATETLPRLAEHPGFRIETTGAPPDYRDVGDSLTVGVSTAEVAGERDWFDLGVTITVEGRDVPFVDVFTALARGETRMLLDDGAHFSLADRRLQSLRTLIEEARALTESPATSLRISRYQADLWGELAALGVVTEQAERWQRAVAPLLDLDALPSHPVPHGLQAELRPYQRDGFAWLATLWDLELGGILADDMGLGKTLQALALVLHARERDATTGPFLVVAPTSVAPNWATEAARFAPGLSVEVVLDTLAKSGRAIKDIATAEIVITTYTLFRLDADAYRTVNWAGLLLDEAQFVKNHRAKTYRCARELDAPFKLAITVTPMENNLMELWALLSLTAPGCSPARSGSQSTLRGRSSGGATRSCCPG
ncbi:MAG TPA: SNF2-related protein, partial [Solirubrobacteraceae bacterium]|nr:SNF2-related protein [Solirubrobacteraceae bacterium]